MIIVTTTIPILIMLAILIEKMRIILSPNKHGKTLSPEKGTSQHSLGAQIVRPGKLLLKRSLWRPHLLQKARSVWRKIPR